MLSYTKNIPIILEAVSRIDPKSVLDIGAGMGKYGLLIREQYISSMAEKGDMEPNERGIRIDAVEDTPYFVAIGKMADRIQAIYDEVFPDDIFKCYNKINEYDLILLIDVVEHWTKEDARLILGELIGKAKKGILISTPKRTGMYDEHFYGDPRHHITQWEPEDFDGFEYEIVESKLSHIIHITGVKGRSLN